jgi:phosphoribosylformylglycinamidine synthase
VRGTLTPQLDASEPDTTLVLVDLGRAATAWAAASWRRRWARAAARGDGVPDLDDPQDLVNLVNAVNALRAKGQILAYHDRSDGGLLRRRAEMAFAGQVGVALNVDMLVTEGDGISDSRMESGDAKNWAGQVRRAARELTLKALFNEELGVVLQVRTAERNAVMQVLREHGLSAAQPFHRQDPPGLVRMDAGKGELQVWRDTKAVFSRQLARPAPGVGQRELEDLPAARQPRLCADAEHAAAGDPADPGLHVH